MQPGGAPNEMRNLILATLISVAIMVGWFFFFDAPRQRERITEPQPARVETQAPAATSDSPPPQPASSSREQTLSASAGARIVIDTPQVDGSIALQGARLDDLSLKNFRQTIERDSPEVTLLSPFGAPHAHDAFSGWEMREGNDNISTLADAASGWRAPEGARLTPATPVVLSFSPGPDLSIERTISVDDSFMFTITDIVRNQRDATVSVRPFGVVRREGTPSDYRLNAIVHQGLLGALQPTTRMSTNFSEADKHARERVRGRVGPDERIEEEQGQGGWFALTDHYWLTALVPDQSEQVSVYFDARTEDSGNSYRAAYRGAWREAPAGGEITYTQRVFAGAKQVDVLQRYQRELNIPRFDDAVDWGNFWFLTRPYFLWIMNPLAKWAGSFAIGILLTTIVIKLLMFPLVYQSFKSMAKMRGLAPKMKEIQERFAADKQRQQQETLKLYQTEKVNPVSGCIPILLQIPVFYALYKVLTNTIEMRHAPFFGWVRDLSAPDPAMIFNLFGLLPYDPAAVPLIGGVLAIGVWPLFYGVTMWALQALSPPPTDPTQAAIFRWMPILFTFMFAGFGAGLVIYWTWSNMLSIGQQYFIMRRQGVETQFDKFLAKWRTPAAAD